MKNAKEHKTKEYKSHIDKINTDKVKTDKVNTDKVNTDKSDVLKDGKIFFVGKKLLSFCVQIIVLSMLVFFIARIAPTDPLQAYYGERTEKMSVEEKEEAREELGLHESIIVQYGYWIKNALQGDFGISYQYKKPVTEVIAGRIGNTLLLGGVGFFLIFAGAIALGIFCAKREDSLLDRVLCKIGTLSGCIPEFWLSLVLILLFCVTWKLLPSSGAYSVGMEHSFTDRLRHLILPLTVVVLSHLWYYAYLVRNRLAEETGKEYVLLCRAKGLSTGEVMKKHCFRNIFPTLYGLMVVAVPHILGGTYIVETVFSYPGLGTLAYESARYADYNTLMLLCLLTGAVVILCNSLELKKKYEE